MTRSKAPLVSVIMPCFNAEKYVEAAIESILNQTFSDFELIIVDDGSSDASASIVKRYIPKDPRIIYIYNNRNCGVVDSLNRGIEKARGTYIARMDADDISHPYRLAKQVTHMANHPKCVVCGTYIGLIDEDGKRIGLRAYDTKDELIRKNILLKSPFAHPSVVIKKETLLQNGVLYSKRFGRAEDYYLWMRLMPLGSFANIDEFLFDYRITSDSIKSKFAKETLKDTLRLKFHYLTHLNPRALLIIFCESLLCLFPQGFIIRLFLALQKFSLLRLGKKLKHQQF